MSESDPSVREAIEAAIDNSNTDSGAPAIAPDAPVAAALPAGAPAPAPVAPAADTPAPERASRSQRDLFAPPPPKFGEEPKTAAQAPTQPTPELRAPQSWKADLRERWKTLPPEVQGEVVRREREHEARMQEHAETKKFADRFSQVAEPYRAFIEAEGADPIAAFHDYLKTATMLRMGSPGDKARMVASLVQQFQIPLPALDAYLAAAIQGGGSVPQQPQQQFQQPQYPQQQFQPQQVFHDPRLDQLLAQQKEREAAKYQSDIAAFAADPTHEFFEDVRGTMADVLDAAAKRGVQLNLNEAYARACQIEPEVKKTIDARSAQGNVSQAARRLAAARHAASSLPSQSAPPAPRSAGSAEPGSVRDSILGAIDQLSSTA